jgi:hypothetical protein
MDIVIHIGTFEYKTNVVGGSMTKILQEIEDRFGVSRSCISDITF